MGEAQRARRSEESTRAITEGIAPCAVDGARTLATSAPRSDRGARDDATEPDGSEGRFDAYLELYAAEHGGTTAARGNDLLDGAESGASTPPW